MTVKKRKKYYVCRQVLTLYWINDIDIVEWFGFDKEGAEDRAKELQDMAIENQYDEYYFVKESEDWY